MRRVGLVVEVGAQKDRLADSLIDQLRQLGELRDAGVLTEEEFAAQKAKLLGS